MVKAKEQLTHHDLSLKGTRICTYFFFSIFQALNRDISGVSSVQVQNSRKRFTLSLQLFDETVAEVSGRPVKQPPFRPKNGS